MKELYNAEHPGKPLPTGFFMSHLWGVRISLKDLDAILNVEDSTNGDIVGIRVYNVERNGENNLITGLMMVAVDAFGKELKDQYFLAGLDKEGRTSGDFVRGNSARFIANLVEKKNQFVSFFSLAMLEAIKGNIEEGTILNGIVFQKTTHQSSINGVPRDTPTFMAGALMATKQSADDLFGSMMSEAVICSDFTSPGYGAEESSDALIKVPRDHDFILNRVASQPYGSEDGGAMSMKLKRAPSGYIKIKLLKEFMSIDECVGVKVFSEILKGSDRHIFFYAVDKNGDLLADRFLTNQFHSGVCGNGDIISRRAGMMLGGNRARSVSYFSRSMLDKLCTLPEKEYPGLAFFENETSEKIKFKGAPQKIRYHFASPAKKHGGKITARSFLGLANGIGTPYTCPGNCPDYELQWSEEILYE